MKFIRFNPDTTVQRTQVAATVSVHPISGLFSLNQAAVEKMKLSPDKSQKVEVLQDEANPEDWYLSVTDTGFLCRGFQGKTSVGFASKNTARAIFKAIDKPEATTSARMNLGAEIAEDGLTLFPIITRSATIRKSVK